MLINLSNHPVSSWEKKQIEVARKLYGEVVDLEFPSVNPNADEEEILTLAEKYSSICAEKLNNNDERNAVHIMGELTFTIAVVNILSELGIVCVASTTERISNVDNGIKTSEFKFVKFRKYSCISGNK